MTQAPQDQEGQHHDAPEDSEPLAPLGGPAEAEPPQHTADPDDAADSPLEDSLPYELAVEDGAPLAAEGGDPGAGDLAPEFRSPDGP